MPAPHVSVIVPNYNRQTLIGETIANLLAQTLPPAEIIIVDDGSTDQSVDVIRSFGGKVKLIQQSNQGPGAARNAGLNIATGELIQFQDSDDLFSLNKLEVQAVLLKDTNADIAFSPWAKLKIENNQVELENHVLQQKMPPPNLSLACWSLRGWSTVFQSLLFRKSFLDKVGLYRTEFKMGEDAELFFRALTASPRVAFSSDALTLYRLHNIAKLTQDEGASAAQRARDWAQGLACMIEHCHETKLPMDFLTRSIFLAGIRKHLRYLRETSATDSYLTLQNYVRQLPAVWLSAIEASLRLTEKVRLRRSGSRWMSAYQAGPLNKAQRELIHRLGFQFSSH